MADRAALPQRGMLKDKGPGLLPVALSAGFIQTCHRQPAGRFEEVAAVRVVALRAVHLLLRHRVVLRKLKFRLLLAMALKASRGVFAGIDDELAPPAAPGDVQAPRSVARFATRLPCRARVLQVDAGMPAGREVARNSLMLPKGRTVDCSLSTRVVSDLAGMATCVLTSNVYS